MNHEPHILVILHALDQLGYRIDSIGRTYINATSRDDVPITVDVRVRRKPHGQRAAEKRPHGRVH